MGLWPTQGDEKRLLEAQSLPLSSRPERSAVEGPAVSDPCTHTLSLAYEGDFAIYETQAGGTAQPVDRHVSAG
jgi:hypothetical protein